MSGVRDPADAVGKFIEQQETANLLSVERAEVELQLEKLQHRYRTQCESMARLAPLASTRVASYSS